MDIRKKNGSYDTYTIELGWGQLTAIRDALVRNHADPLRDEILNNINWSMDRLPKPGEDKEDKEPKGEERPPSARPGSVVAPKGYDQEDFDLDSVLPPPGEEGAPEVEGGGEEHEPEEEPVAEPAE